MRHKSSGQRVSQTVFVSKMERARKGFFHFAKNVTKLKIFYSLTGELKAHDQLAWARLVNNGRVRVEEIIFNELIYS